MSRVVLTVWFEESESEDAEYSALSAIGENLMSEGNGLAYSVDEE